MSYVDDAVKSQMWHHSAITTFWIKSFHFINRILCYITYGTLGSQPKL